MEGLFRCRPGSAGIALSVSADDGENIAIAAIPCTPTPSDTRFTETGNLATTFLFF
jgi:hypothetical protein